MEQLLLKKADLQNECDRLEEDVQELVVAWKNLEQVISMSCRARAEIKAQLVKVKAEVVQVVARNVKVKAEIMIRQVYRTGIRVEEAVKSAEEVLKQAEAAVKQVNAAMKQAGDAAAQAEILRLRHILMTNGIEYDEWKDEQYDAYLAKVV